MKTIEQTNAAEQEFHEAETTLKREQSVLSGLQAQVGEAESRVRLATYRRDRAQTLLDQARS